MAREELVGQQVLLEMAWNSVRVAIRRVEVPGRGVERVLLQHVEGRRVGHVQLTGLALDVPDLELLHSW